jgi:Fe-S cluster biogenesis protein NfuA
VNLDDDPRRPISDVPLIVIPRRTIYNSTMTPVVETVPTTARDRVRDVIDLIRPSVQADGGDIELVDVTPAGVVQVRFHGACHGCPSSHMTLHMGIERNLRERVPEVTGVVAVT